MDTETTECPICFEADDVSRCVLGCEHRFCRACIQRWCIERRAFCPMCETPVLGILPQAREEARASDRPFSVFLSPHVGYLGVTAKTVDDRLYVGSVAPHTVAHAYRVRPGSQISVPGHTGARATADAIQSVRGTTRMIEVTLTPSCAETRANAGVRPGVVTARERWDRCVRKLFACFERALVADEPKSDFAPAL